jgi:hypothetical protein
LTEVKMDNTFIGVKLGDVDGTASVNVLSKQTEPRNAGIRLRAEDRLIQAGEEIVVPITAEQFTAVHGMQWTMKHEGLELIAIDGRGIELREDHTGKIRANTTTLSWASTNAITVAQGSEVMRLTFRAAKAVKLSSSLQITSEVTNAEAYVGAAMERSSIVLDIRSNDISNDFYVGQNEPNPWKSGTVINYTLPKAGAVKLTILDVTGRIIRTYDANGVAGENAFKITREQINEASGILMYKIESGTYTAQRKMIVIE